MEDELRIAALARLVESVQRFANANPGSSKDVVARAVAAEFELKRDRSVFAGQHFSVRFSTASGKSFSNVVLSLSAIRKYDQLPFVVCVVRPSGIQLLLANTTLLKKVSHSSHQLRIDNVKGSILGHDIMRTFDELPNEPKNFEALFVRHREFTWEENLARLVEATNAIAGTGVRFQPNDIQVERILAAVDVARSIQQDKEYIALQIRLAESVQASRAAILGAAQIDNVNIRGNRIEQIVTSAGNLHRAEDIAERLSSGVEVNIDVKTKLLNLASSPKAYNIDKVLRLLANGNSAFAFLFIGIDLHQNTVSSRLVSILDRVILDATRIQFHWAGRNSRGVTQLAGDLSSLYLPGFREVIDLISAREFLSRLIAIGPAAE